MTFEEFKAEANKRNLFYKKCTETHWQVRGKRLVNYYPTKGKIHIAGHPVVFGNIQKAMELADVH